ncbi:uncharacterized protein LOC119553575 [Drosophila subpulchrella]|uniref:uncharacterized protein LOC119553575 n=1 Tax=Drosophila subpulchrella TaxID=1486046 RepID=UPI0018A1A565|nr:uncharacterized protein LOC119553575 [Drosophila subpulchrella]
MRALCVLSLIACLGIALISTKPLNENGNPKESKSNKTEIDKIIKNLQLLEKLANETLYLPNPTSQDPTGEEAKEPTEDDAEDPTGEETEEPTGEEEKEPTIIEGEDGEFYIVEEEKEDNDFATLDKPTEALPGNFLKYPAQEPDFKPYPRFAILRNSYVHHMNLDF